MVGEYKISFVNTAIITFTKKGFSLPVAILVSSTFSVILLALKDNKYFRNICIMFCGPTKTREHFHDVLSWHLIFLRHPSALHENITLEPRPFSLEDDITTLSH